MLYVYILKWKSTGDLYIGYTNDLKRRMREHNNEASCTIIYYEAYQTEDLARDRERKLKHYGSSWRALGKRITS
ncbi:hypothetical protein COB64_01935 [Candidatus Wolfebacteria bacterium]|nr:MAG: hypothetical protein COB64_01935 [Candidatus Wolfebacteria bacterium]